MLSVQRNFQHTIFIYVKEEEFLSHTILQSTYGQFIQYHAVERNLTVHTQVLPHDSQRDIHMLTKNIQGYDFYSVFKSCQRV